MSQRNANSRLRTAAAAVTILLVSLGIAACGGSSTGTSSQAATTAASTATGPTTTGRRARFGALRECLQKDGVTLPKRTPGQTPGGGLLGGGGGVQLPKGVSRAQFETALKKCGGANFARRAPALSTPARIQALTKFAACMRASGINLPAPNTSGNGPVFSTKGLDLSSARFRQAEAKCSSELKGAFGGRGSGGGPRPGGGAPGSPGG
jgi:hypothetical protein